MSEIDRNVQTFSDAILRSVEICTPIHRQIDFNFIKLPDEIIDLIRERNYLRQQWQR